QVSDELSQQLKNCAERIAQTDTEMQEIFYKLNEA
ncbi:MAG TPA: GTP pyrophosphokinase, partial [Ruminococcus sp.]|nr:GTP pyrophosphokinase [Ruminococcus sp.]